MILSDLIRQTRSVLPLFDNRFTTNISIVSVLKVADDVTVNAIAHKVSVGDEIIISGVKTDVIITDITTVGGIATATTSADHDLTFGWTLNANISSPEAAYNGVFEILSVPTWETFTFAASGTPPVSTGTLHTFHNAGFNGVQVVSAVIDVDNFQYLLEDDRLTAGSGPNMLFMKNPRISGAATVERAIASYTKFGSGKVWGFFVIEGMSTSSDRSVDNDSKNERVPGQDFKLRLINDLGFYVFIPTHEEISGRLAMDTAQELAKPLYKTLAGYLIEEIFTTTQQTELMPSDHDIFDYNTAYLIYRYGFQATEFMLSRGSDSDPDAYMADTGDIISNQGTRALRKFEVITQNEFDEDTKDDNFDV